MQSEQKENKQYKSILTNRVDKSEWTFPTKAVGNFSGIVVEMHGIDNEANEGHGTVLIGDSDRPVGTIKKTWQLHNFTPVDVTIEKVQVVKPAKA